MVEPVFAVIFSEMGMGKSSDMIYSQPMGYFVGPKGGITKVMRTVVGYDVATDDGQFYAIQELVNYVLPMLARGLDPVSQRPAKYTALILDDLSILADRELKRQQANNSHSKNAYVPYTETAKWLAALRDVARGFGIHVLCNAHPMGAWIDERTGVRYKGRPKLAGKEAPVSFPPLCDVVLRAVMPAPTTPIFGAGAPAAVNGGAVATPAPFSSAPPAAEPASSNFQVDWPGLFRNNPLDPDWLTKSRLNTPDYAPMNLAEIMRHGGYHVPRVSALEWTEELVEQGVGYVLSGTDEDRVLREFAVPILKQKVQDRNLLRFAALWVRRDLKARAALRRARLDVDKVLGI